MPKHHAWRASALAAWSAISLGLGSPVLAAEEVGQDSISNTALAGPNDTKAASPIKCKGQLTQGGMAVCRGIPHARIQIGIATSKADENGVFIVGFDRDAPAQERARIWHPNGELYTHTFAIKSRPYTISRIDGLPPSQVNPRTKAQLARIRASSSRKKQGDASRARLTAFEEGFSLPLETPRKTTVFGAQRILNGEPKRPHYGVDLAAPQGTPIKAPADGIVSLADENLYFEGAMIVLDHGQGFLSKYLHVSRIDVVSGEHVRRGQVIGAVGSRGRSTGPHLCWRLKWRDRNLDPELWLQQKSK